MQYLLLRQFKKQAALGAKWLIAINKISENLNIQRLCVQARRRNDAQIGRLASDIHKH